MTDGADDRGAPGAGTVAGQSGYGRPAGRPAPGWYPDPWVSGQHRYWKGEQWTADVFPDGPIHHGPDQAPAWAPYEPYMATETAPSEEPPARIRSGRPLAALALVVGLIVGFVAVIAIVNTLTEKSKPTPPAAAPAAPAVTPPPETAPVAPADPNQSALSGLVVGQTDVPATVTVQPLPAGDVVTGQATLDVCNGTFPSEALRTARLQVDATDAQGNRILSTEAVLYQTAAATAQGFAELKAVAASCPATPVASPVGEPTVTTHFNPPPDGAWPQTPTVERLAFDFTATDAAGQTGHSMGVYLRRGRVLMGVYFPQPDGPQGPVGGKTSPADIVNVFAKRMAQLPASVVNGG